MTVNGIPGDSFDDGRPLYPGFTDPDDWREARDARGWPQVSVPKVGQVVDDATADHDRKHKHHHHPWCLRCSMTEGMGDVEYKSAADLYQWRRALIQRGINEHALSAFGEKWGSGTPDKRLAEICQIPDELLEETVRYAQEKDRSEAAWADARSTTYRRALRYLDLHRNPPADTFDPDVVDPLQALEGQYLDGDELDDLPTPEPLIDGVLTRHAYAILSCRDGTLKTFTALDWALCLATGKAWQSREAEQVRVLYVAGEGAYGLAARKRAWEYAWQTEVDPDRFTVRTSAVNLFKGGIAFEHLLTKVTEGGYGLVVVDTLRRSSGGAQENGSDMGVVVDRVDQIKQATLDGSVLVVAHTGKDDKDTRGYSGIEDDCDIVWNTDRDGNRLTLKNTKMKDGPDGLQVILEPLEVLESLVLQAASEVAVWTVDSSDAERHLLAVLLEHFTCTPATTTTLRQVSELPKTSFYRALGKLIERGTAVNVGTKRAALYEPASHLVPKAGTPSDLPVSQQSQAVPTGSQVVPPSPTPLRGGTWD